MPSSVFILSDDTTGAKVRLAQLIKELRGNVSQREFARLLGISYTTIQDWEKQVRLPSLSSLNRLSQLTGWTQAELLSYLSSSENQPEPQDFDSLGSVIDSLQKLSMDEIQKLSHYLDLNLSGGTGNRSRRRAKPKPPKVSS